MGRLTGQFWRYFRQWDRPVQFAFGLICVLFIPTVLAVAFGPRSLRTPALIGLVGLIIAAQVIFMWANRGMLTPYAQAQRLYLAEDFEGACAILETYRSTGKADVRALTLLGNTYRQRGLLTQSEQVLLEAVDIAPNHHFPLYGFGRTLLVQGRYAEAVPFIERALANGAAAVVGLDAGEACYREGQPERARQLIEAALPASSEPHRRLMGQYVLYRLDAVNRPDSTLIAEGLSYWQAQANRYSDTPYGQALADDIRAMEILAQEA